MNIYLQLTQEFNAGRPRAVLAGGQAVVLYRLAIMSKDGDWILREDDEALDHVREVLERYDARYRFGAPLQKQWMAGGWSAHLEFMRDRIRVRTDFMTRPPRLSGEDLDRMWERQSGHGTAVVSLKDLAELKKTNREKDYAVIGELARRMTDVDDRLLYSRSARDLAALAVEHPERVNNLLRRRPALGAIARGLAELEAALDGERRAMIHANEARLEAFMAAAQPWADMWPLVDQEIGGRPLRAAHRLMVRRAKGVLPYGISESLR